MKRGAAQQQVEPEKKIGIWIRVSTEEQVKGESPEHHERRARLYAESKGWTVETVYHLEAVSGKSVTRNDNRLARCRHEWSGGRNHWVHRRLSP